jgi:hypothetical protein
MEEIRIMKRGWILLLALAALSVFLCIQAVQAAVPQMINYQGTLTEANGTPVANGNYNIQFKIYEVPSGGTVLWSEKWDTSTSQITVVGGIFNVMLGFVNPIPDNFFANHPVTYLGIKVGTDSEMLPRQQITSVGYAFTAGNGVPKRAIIMWSGAINEIPAGWALCDGVERTLPDGTKITPPDLRDRFVLGASGGYGVGDTGGSSSINLEHGHSISNYTHAHTRIAGSAGWTTGGSPMSSDTHNHGGVTGNSLISAQKILPPYYALAYIMKL